MTLRFDDKTGNLTEAIIKDNKLLFISSSKEIYETTPEETLIYYEDNNVNSFSKYKIQIKNALQDYTNPRIKKKCIKCKKETIVIPIQIGNNLLNICSICKENWIEMSE